MDRRRESQRDWESCYRTRKRRICEATPTGLVDDSDSDRAVQSKESLYGRETDRDLRSAFL